MAKVYEFLADGFEEVEGMGPVDVLRRLLLERRPRLQLLRIGERDAVHALQRVVARIAQPVARAVLHNGKALHESS